MEDHSLSDVPNCLLNVLTPTTLHIWKPCPPCGMQEMPCCAETKDPTWSQKRKREKHSHNVQHYLVTKVKQKMSFK